MRINDLTVGLLPRREDVERAIEVNGRERKRLFVLRKLIVEMEEDRPAWTVRASGESKADEADSGNGSGEDMGTTPAPTPGPTATPVPIPKGAFVGGKSEPSHGTRTR